MSRPAVGMPETPWAALIASVLLVVAPLLALSQIASYWRVDVVDDQLFGLFGWRIANGATVYVDVWDNKPPGIYWINALGFLLGRGSYLGVIALCALASGVALASFFVISASIYYRGAAALATVLACFYLFHGFYEGGTNRGETFLMALELTAVAFYVRGFARDAWWKWAAAGACCGCAFLFKQVGLAAWGAMGLHTILLMLARDVPLRDGLRRGVLLTLGAATPVALAAGALARQGALAEALYATFTFNQAYFEAGRSSFLHTFTNRYFLRQHMMPILKLPLLMAVAALIHSFLWWLRPHLRPAEIEEPNRALRPVCPRYMLLFSIWFAAAFYGAVLSPHYFEHYLLPMLPPLMLMAGYVIHFLRTEIGLARRLQQRAWVTCAFVFMGYLAISAVDLHLMVLSKVWIYRFERKKSDDASPAQLLARLGRQIVGREPYLPSEWEAVAAAVVEHSRPDDRIQCFGYLPGVYLHARRLNATRYTTTEKIGQLAGTQHAERIRRHLIERLGADPPALLVMSTNDYLTVTYPERAREPVDSLGAWLKPFLERHYALVADVVEFQTFVFKRLDLIEPAERRLTPPAAAQM